MAHAWCDHLETHARRIYALGANIAFEGAKRVLEKIKSGSLTDGFKACDIYHQGWSFLDTKESTQAALEELMEAGWLREIRPPAPDKQGGRPAGPVYRIHPAAREILKGK